MFDAGDIMLNVIRKSIDSLKIRNGAGGDNILEGGLKLYTDEYGLIPQELYKIKQQILKVRHRPGKLVS